MPPPSRTGQRIPRRPSTGTADTAPVPFEELFARELGLAPVINAAGKLTALGGSAQSVAVAAAQAAIAGWHVDLQALRDAVAGHVARWTGAEAACITTGAAAGIAISVAACITGNRLDRVLRLPDSTGLAHRVLLQAGHDVHFGAGVTQMIRLGGGIVQRIGWANSVPGELLDEALAEPEGIAAMLYVQSHHAVQENMIPLARCIEACHRRNVPVIVDAAAEDDLRTWLDQGADLVTYSGGKAFGGPTSGFIVGRRDLVEACELQGRGIARTMKVGKEQLAGLFVALTEYVGRDEAALAATRDGSIAALQAALADVPGLRTAIRADEAGRRIHRLAVAREDGGDIRELVRFLARGTPCIRVREHHLDDGIALLDPRELGAAQVAIIAERIRAFFTQAGAQARAQTSAQTSKAAGKGAPARKTTAARTPRRR